MRPALALLLLLAVPLVAAPVPKGLKKASPTLDGTWEIVEWHFNESVGLLTDDIRWAIDGDKLTVTGRKQNPPANFAANVTRTLVRPDGGGGNAVDYTIGYTDGTPTRVRPAVFELKGDRLTFCLSNSYDGPRPSECKAGQGVTVYVLKRVEVKSK